MKPSTRVVSVMPSWHAESWVESRRCEVSTDRAPGSPASTARCTGGSVEGDERELGRDEQGRAHGEDDAEEQQQPCGHDRTIVWGHRAVPLARVSTREAEPDPPGG